MTIPVAPQEMSPTDPKRIGGVWSFIARFNALIAWIKSLSPSGATVYDTGWVPVTIRPGFARQGSNDPAVRRIGKTVYWRWGFSNAGMAANGSYTVADIPAGFRPPNAAAEVYTYAASSSVTAGGRFTVYSNGQVVINTAATLGSYYLAEASWLVE